MKELFIPEIGTELVLAKDWKFELYAESRNKNLLEYYGAYLNPGYRTIIFEKDLPNFKLEYDVDFPCNAEDYYSRNFVGKRCFNREAYYKAKEWYINNNPINIEYNREVKIWHEKRKLAPQYDSIPALLKKGSTLKVDRIYIRKGASDFSSISFYVTLGSKKYRFWAKLDDCNKIVFK